MGRSQETRKRRREILDAALGAFHDQGYEKTTLADIRDRAGASIGSIYHHFSGKEQIFAALYLDAIANTQAFGLRALRRAENLEDGVRALVGSYLRWVKGHRELAAFVLSMRRTEFMPETERELDRMNGEFRVALEAWWAERDDAQVWRVAPDLLFAVLIGPSEEFARRWLRGKTRTSFRHAADILAEAAWLSLDALRSGKP